MRERRRAVLAERQALIGRVARLQALHALAEALRQEERSCALAARSRRMLQSAQPGPGCAGGEELAARSAFAASLARLARDARSAARDHARLVERQATALAWAQNRAKRLEQRADAARDLLARTGAQRRQVEGAGMARKLQERGRQ